jgi:uncharacterized membrane protein YqjE
MSVTERSISVVLRDIVRDIQEIVRSEVRLAKTELHEELTKTRSASLLIALGAASGVFSMLFALLTIVYALSIVIPAWLAALCVAAGIGVVAAVTTIAGVRLLKTINAAPKTVASMKENIEWAKQQVK